MEELTQNFNESELEIYFKYSNLEVKDLQTILNDFDSLYDKILKITSPIYVLNEIPFRNFLELSSINTGESIRIKFKEGWKPEFGIEEDELTISIPKKLGVPAILALLFLNGVQESVQTYNQLLDSRIKQLDIQLKENDLNNKLQEAKENRGIRSIQLQVNKTIKNIINNQNVTHFEINKIEIRSEKED